jgi:site-specific DNA recombinase
MALLLTLILENATIFLLSLQRRSCRIMKVVYGRVSIKEQSTKGYGLKNQLDECKAIIGDEEHLTFVDEGISGEILDRPGLTALRDVVQKGIVTEIVCYDPDRLSRKLMHQLMLDEEFRKQGVKLTFVNGSYADTPEGQLFKNMRGSIAEFEKEKIKQRTKGGKIRKAKEGKVLGNYGLYGYDYDKEKKTYVINEEQAKIVKMIFDYFTEPTSPFKGINGIAKHLTSMGIPTARNGKVWHRQVVRQILLNISYTGKHPHNRYNSEGDYVRKQSGLKSSQKIRPEEEWIIVEIPAIITEEQFHVAQELIKESKRRFAKDSLHEYLLSGLVRCKDCGNTMTGAKASWWGKKVFLYSDFKNYSGAKNKGCGNQIHTHELDEVVWEHIHHLLNNPEEINSYKQSEKVANMFDGELQQIKKELEKNKKGRQRLLSLVAMSDELDLTDIKEQLEEMSAKEKTLQKKYTQLEKELKAAKGESNEEMIRSAIEYLTTNRDSVTFEVKKNTIRLVVKQIYVSKDHEEVEIQLF